MSHINVIVLCFSTFTNIHAKETSHKDKQIWIESFEKAFVNNRASYATIEERMALFKVPALSIAIIKNGKLHWAKAYGIKREGSQEKVDTNTVFSAASISKVITATMILKLKDKGFLDIDKNINLYLKQWKVPKNKFTKNNPVTLRRIMSHTAGFNISGFKDFMPGENLPTGLDTLLGRKPAKHGAVKIFYSPGTSFQYSGGGVIVEQTLIEDVTSLSFPESATNLIFKPLNMNRSTFENPIPESFGNIASAHGSDGRLSALPRGWESMPEIAASGLWSTPSDLAKIIIALMVSYDGIDGSLISQETAIDMMTQVEPGPFGLGPKLSKNDLFGHSGSNKSYKSYFLANLKTKNAIVVMANSKNSASLVQEIIETKKRIEKW